MKTDTPLKIKFEKPPVWDSVCAAFNINPVTALFTYGDTVYIPCGKFPPQDLIVHEQVHIKQQNANEEDAKLWWGKYLRDPKFRLEQEAEAYGAQYAFLCKTIKGREQRFQVVRQLATIMTGPLYDHPCDLMTGIQMIKSKANIK